MVSAPPVAENTRLVGATLVAAVSRAVTDTGPAARADGARAPASAAATTAAPALRRAVFERGARERMSIELRLISGGFGGMGRDYLPALAALAERPRSGRSRMRSFRLFSVGASLRMSQVMFPRTPSRPTARLGAWLTISASTHGLLLT